MNYIDYSKKLSFIETLVKKSATGSPKELAYRLQVSEKTIRRMINHLRNEGCDIKYSRIRQSYILK